MRGVGRDDDRPQPGGGAAAGGRGGDAGLADAALAGVEDGPRGGPAACQASAEARIRVLRYAGARLAHQLRSRLTLTRTRNRLCRLRACRSPIPAFVAGCGGDDSSERGPADRPRRDLQQRHHGHQRRSLPDRIGERRGRSGGQLRGQPQRPVPGRPRNQHAIPQLDWTRARPARAPAQSIDFSGGLVVTEDNAYVEYNGKAYEVGTEQFTQLKRPDRGPGRRRGAPDRGHVRGAVRAGDRAGRRRRLRLRHSTPSRWLTNDDQRGHRGRRRHRHGPHRRRRRRRADAHRHRHAASSVPGADSQGFDPTQLSASRRAVTDASIDVYSGADDHVLRKLDVQPDHRPVGGRAGGHGDPDRQHPGLVRARDRRPQRGADDRGARPTRSRSTSCSATSALDLERARRARRRPARRRPAPAAAAPTPSSSACSRRPAPRRSTPAPPSSRHSATGSDGPRRERRGPCRAISELSQ